MSYDEFVTDVVKVVEAAGTAIMVIGGLAALIAFVPATFDAERRPSAYEQLRRTFGRCILLGLEVLIVARPRFAHREELVRHPPEATPPAGVGRRARRAFAYDWRRVFHMRLDVAGCEIDYEARS